jgi:methyl-accepting chemotaxis protein
MESTLVGLGTEVSEDAIVVATIFSAAPFGVGVSHGHRPLTGPLEVTHAEGSVVYTINGRPAWEVWQEELRAHDREGETGFDAIPEDEIGALLLRYEAGLASGDELRIRAPLARKTEDGSIHFACGMPTGTVFRITQGEPQGQIESARRAARRARAQIGGGAVAGAIVFDCICRSLILGDRFGEAVRGISDELGGAPLAGFETYGEIALDVGELSGFHNTTTVVMAIGE